MNSAGDAGRDEGIARAARRADKAIVRWTESAYDMLLQLAPKAGEFTAPEIRSLAEAAGLPPAPSRLAWGSPFRLAARAGRIVRVGYRPYGDETMHTQVISVWRAAA